MSKKLVVKLTEHQAKQIAIEMVDKAKEQALDDCPNDSPYPYMVGVLQVVIKEILRTSDISLNSISEYIDRENSELVMIDD